VPAIGNRMINARAESVAQKPAFRAAFRHRRCLLPADGFFEWKKYGTKKQPMFITMADRAPFAFAGLWEHWQGDDGSEIESCTIITTEPNELCRAIHSRMPVIIGGEDHVAWLDADSDDAAALLRPYPAELMAATPVSTYVNSPKHDDPTCVQPLARQGELF